MTSEDEHKLALKRFSLALDADRDNRKRALEDAEFVAGEQWPQQVVDQRRGRPCLTINRLPTFVRQVSNEVRLKPPSINILPAEDGDRATAEVLEGLVRSIESRSKAKRIYARAIEDSSRCGMGFWRVDTEYANDETFDLDLVIRPISNPLGVLFDPDMTDPLGADAKFCFVIDTMTESAFREKYGEDASSGIDGDNTSQVNATGEWSQGEKVQVAEYWCVKERDSEIVLLDNGETVDIEDYDKALEAFEQAFSVYEQQAAQAAQNGGMVEPLPAMPRPVVGPDGKPRTRKVKRKKVVSYIMSGGDFLQGPFDWAGSRIPIIPVWGEEYRVGDRRVRTSLIHWSKDSQRMINYWRSASIEALALAPKAPWLVTADQIAGFEKEWASSGTGNPVVLRYNADPKAQSAPQRQMPPPMQTAMLQEAALAQDDLKATTGIYDASLGAKSNETSGKAILARQQEGDVGTFVFLDNLLSAVEETGRVIVDLVPKIYDVPRQIRILGKKMEADVISVNDGGQYDLTRGKYDVHIVTGPSFTTQRQMAADMFQQMLQSVPMLAPVLIPRMVAAMELPDGDEIAAEIAQAAQGQQQQPQQPDPKDLAQANKYQAEAEQTAFETALAQSQLQNMQGFPGSAMSPQSVF